LISKWHFLYSISPQSLLLHLNPMLQPLIYKILQYNSYLDYEMILAIGCSKNLVNPIRIWFSWSRRILDSLIFRNKSSLNRNWILFILLLKRKLAIAWKENYFTLICFFYFKPLSSSTQLDFLGPSSPLEKQGIILTLSMYVCMNIKREKKSPLDGGFGGGLISTRNAAQSRECGACRNPAVTSLLI